MPSYTCSERKKEFEIYKEENGTDEQEKCSPFLHFRVKTELSKGFYYMLKYDLYSKY